MARGRRPGSSGTREGILAAARASFSATGYEATSVRGIAREAGVDPALVHHFFGTKRELFVAALELPVDPALVVRGLLADGREDVGARLVRTLLALWDSPDGAAFIGLLRTAATDESAARMVREFLADAILGEVAGVLGGDEPRLRASLAASQVMGLAMARKVVRVEPLATADPERLAAAVGPTLDRYLTGPLG